MEAEKGMMTLPRLIIIKQKKEGTPRVSKFGFNSLHLAELSIDMEGSSSVDCPRGWGSQGVAGQQRGCRSSEARTQEQEEH